MVIGVLLGPKSEGNAEKVSSHAQKLPAADPDECLLATPWRVAQQMLLVKADEVARNGA
jgi:hypothetical protein